MLGELILLRKPSYFFFEFFFSHGRSQMEWACVTSSARTLHLSIFKWDPSLIENFYHKWVFFVDSIALNCITWLIFNEHYYLLLKFWCRINVCINNAEPIIPTWITNQEKHNRISTSEISYNPQVNFLHIACNRWYPNISHFDDSEEYQGNGTFSIDQLDDTFVNYD